MNPLFSLSSEVADTSVPDSTVRRRLLSAGVSLAISPLLLTGCGGGDGADAPPATAPSTVTPPPDSTPPASEVVPPVSPPAPAPVTPKVAPIYSAAAGGIGEFLTAKGWEQLHAMSQSDTLILGMMNQLKGHGDDFAAITPTPVRYSVGGKTELQPIPYPTLTAAETAAARKAVHGNLGSIKSAAQDWRVNRRAETLLAVRNMLVAWARVHEPYGNPLIDEALLSPAIAYFHVREALSDADRAVVEPWLRKVVDRNREWFQRITAIPTAGRNNWMAHGLCHVVVSALAIDSTADLRWAADAAPIFLGEHIEPGGESVDFRGRDALAYHCFSLRGLVMLAQAMNIQGISLYDHRASASGNGSMKTAMAFLIPYVEKTREHLEYVNTKYAPDKTSIHVNDVGKAWQFFPGPPFTYADAYDARWGNYARAKARVDTPGKTYLHRFPEYDPSWVFNEVTQSLAKTHPAGVTT